MVPALRKTCGPLFGTPTPPPPPPPPPEEASEEDDFYLNEKRILKM